MKLLENKKYLYLIFIVVILTTSFVLLFLNKEKDPAIIEEEPELNFYFEYESLSLEVGDDFDLEVKFAGAIEDVFYTSSDDSVATVAESGKIKALKVGDTIITAITPTGEKTTLEIIVFDEETVISSVIITPKK